MAEELAASIPTGTTGGTETIVGSISEPPIVAVDALDVVTVAGCGTDPHPKLLNKGILGKYELIVENTEDEEKLFAPALIR